MYKLNDASIFILKMIDFPYGKQHVHVLFIYTMAAHLPRHTLRPVLVLVCILISQKLQRFFVDGGSTPEYADISSDVRIFEPWDLVSAHALQFRIIE